MTVLQKMISDVEKSPINFYKPSATLWKELSKMIDHTVMEEGINNVQSQHQLNSMFSYVLELGNLKSEIPLWVYYTYLKSKDTYGILELTSALPSNKLDFSASSIKGRPVKNNDKLLNWDYLISIDTIQTIAEVNPSILKDTLNICEIGAGWGRVGYYLTQVNKNISYNIFDIPHTLYVCHEYLKKEVKHTRVYDYQESKDLLSEKIFKPGISFYTPHFLELFESKSFDLVINIASFQEMNYDQVSGYFNKINDLSNMFYTQQRYSDLVMNYQKYPQYANWNKLFDRDINFHPLWFEQMYIIE